MSLSEGNAKTGLEQILVTDSRKAYGPHKSTVITQRKIRKIRKIRPIRKIRDKIKTACALVPGGHYHE